jgi:hypothetical protein
VRRIKNWNSWIAESLEQNPLLNLPDGVTLYTDARQAHFRKEEVIFRYSGRMEFGRVRKEMRREWNRTEHDYLDISKLSQKYNLKLSIEGYLLLIESNVGPFTITKVTDGYYWVEKFSSFFDDRNISFEVDQRDSLIELLILLLESGDKFPKGVTELRAETFEIEKYKQMAWKERVPANQDDWLGTWTEEEIEKLSSPSEELRELFTNHYNFHNGIFMIYSENNTFILTKLSDNEYWIEMDQSYSDNEKRYFRISGIDSLRTFLKMIFR